jgi:hypothetical protein
MTRARVHFNSCITVNHFVPKQRAPCPMPQVPRRLGAGVPLTILWFAPLAQLHPVLGFLRLNAHVSQVQGRGVRIVEPETTSLKRETSRRPNFFIFRPIEVSKEPRQGFWDAGKPLEQLVCQFEHCKTCF